MHFRMNIVRSFNYIFCSWSLPRLFCSLQVRCTTAPESTACAYIDTITALMRSTCRFRPLLWLLSTVMAVLGTIAAFIHRGATADLYENAVHRKTGFVLVLCISVQTCFHLFGAYKEKDRQDLSSSRFLPLTQQDDSDDSARSSATLFRRRTPPIDMRISFDGRTRDELEPQKVQSVKHPVRSLRYKFGGALGQLNVVLLLGATYIQILLGVATYCGLFTNHEIFNGLAHWIKASIFLLFGIWVFMRYLGYANSIGHAWNTVRGQHVSAERIECGLIFTYGISNLFLERLGHSDEPVSHTDIQHMSIAAMFACAGFVGLLFESRYVQDLLRVREPVETSIVGVGDYHAADHLLVPKTFNVMPALVVFFTGLLMSQHKQDSQFTTDLHATWGYFFCIASGLRLLTYCLTYLATRSALSGRPPSEVLVAFSLIAGALVFMMSSRDTAQVLEYYAIDLMFCISLAVAGALGIMVWTMYLMILRGSDHRRSG